MSRIISVAVALATAALLASPVRMMAQDDSVAVALKQMLQEAKEQVEEITVDETAKLMSEGAACTLLDIRAEAEYTAGHLPGALWIPRGKIEFVASGQLPSHDTLIIVYCRIDGRSALCAQTLKRLGYNQIAFLKGGFKSWVEAGHTIFNQHGELVVKEFEKKEE